MKRLVVGTRGSALARAQCEQAVAPYRALGCEVVLEIVETRGDREPGAPVAQLGGVGFFTAELVAALRERRVDAAVHSYKDLPVEEHEGLVVAAVPVREDDRDVLVSRERTPLSGLPQGARVGTASPRRKAMLLHARPDLEIVPLRGNVDTRLRRVESGELDGVVLAAAGLKRLGRAAAISEPLDFLPAPAQGALAIQARADDTETVAFLARRSHEVSALRARAERALLAELGGGCSAPVGARALAMGPRLALFGCVLSPDGRRKVEADAAGEEPSALARAVAAELREQGAEELLRA